MDSAPSRQTDSLPARLRSISMVYPGGVNALTDVDLEIKSGQLLAVIGSNGSGKTSLLRLLAGKLRPTSGEALVFGTDIAQTPEQLRSRIGYVSQELALDPEMTGAETLQLFATLHGVSRERRRELCRELAEQFQLAGQLDRPISSYSGGQRQRLHLAVGMTHRPDLFLLDEPAAGLDLQGRAVLWSALTQLSGRGQTAVVVTHDLDQAQQHCQRVLILDQGKLVWDGQTADLISRHAGPGLLISLEDATDREDALKMRLKTLPEVASCRLDGAQLRIAFTQGRDGRKAVLATLDELGLNVKSLQVAASDLATAYFTLTGQSLAASPWRGRSKADRAASQV